MRIVFLLLLIPAFILSDCSKRPCGCTPPLPSESSWYIIKRHGGFAGIDFPLTDAQQNSYITLKPAANYAGGNYISVYTVSNSITTGSYSISVSNNQATYLFTPRLPMFDEDQLILVENTNQKLVFWDGNADGIYTTFARR